MSTTSISPNPFTDLHKGLATDGAVTFTAGAGELLGGVGEWKTLSDSWNRLEVDQFMVSDQTYRCRRYGFFEAVKGDEGWSFVAVSKTTFLQDADVIPFYGGRVREFEPMESEVMGNEALAALLHFDIGLTTSVAGDVRRATVGLHQIRITGAATYNAPAPEGRHADGHDFVAMHLMNRVACVGGVSRVYAKGQAEPFIECTLTAAGDSIIVDDRRVEHEVTPILATGDPSYRDMLLVDIEFS